MKTLAEQPTLSDELFPSVEAEELHTVKIKMNGTGETLAHLAHRYFPTGAQLGDTYRFQAEAVVVQTGTLLKNDEEKGKTRNGVIALKICNFQDFELAPPADGDVVDFPSITETADA